MPRYTTVRFNLALKSNGNVVFELAFLNHTIWSRSSSNAFKGSRLRLHLTLRQLTVVGYLVILSSSVETWLDRRILGYLSGSYSNQLLPFGKSLSLERLDLSGSILSNALELLFVDRFARKHKVDLIVLL